MTWSLDLSTNSAGDPSIALVSDDTGSDLRSALSVAQGIQAMMTEDPNEQLTINYPAEFTPEAIMESFASDANRYRNVLVRPMQDSGRVREGFISIDDDDPEAFEASLVEGAEPDLFEGLLFVSGTLRLLGAGYLADAFDPIWKETKTYRVEFLRQTPAMPAIYRKEIDRALGR